jgi:hypothetical protein
MCGTIVRQNEERFPYLRSRQRKHTDLSGAVIQQDARELPCGLTRRDDIVDDQDMAPPEFAPNDKRIVKVAASLPGTQAGLVLREPPASDGCYFRQARHPA